MKTPVRMIEKWKQNNGESDPDLKSEFPRSGKLLYSDVWQHKCLLHLIRVNKYKL